MEKQQREQVDRNIKEAKEKLEAELESAKHEHQLMLMRQGRGWLLVSSLNVCVFTAWTVCLCMKADCFWAANLTVVWMISYIGSGKKYKLCFSIED